MCADFLSDELELGQYDTVVSWFVFLHTADRAALLSRCMDCLRPGGFLYVNDFHEIDTLTSEEKHSLEVDVFCNWLPSIELFHQQCAQAGFASVETVDKTAAAIEFARDRESAWDETRERQMKVHGQAVTDGLEHFFGAVHRLFQGGHFGVVDVLAQKT